MRNSATFHGRISRTWRRRYASSAEAERSTACHCTVSRAPPTSVALGSRIWYFTSRMRVALSARSSILPKRMNSQPSLRGKVESVRPWNWCDARMMRLKNSCGPRRQTSAALVDLRMRCSSLMTSHISREIWSRIMRAFSRAAWTQDRMEPACRRSKARKSVTVWLSAAAWSLPNSSAAPELRIRDSQQLPGAAECSWRSARKCRLTSSSLAVFSARSICRLIQ